MEIRVYNPTYKKKATKQTISNVVNEKNNSFLFF